MTFSSKRTIKTPAEWLEDLTNAGVVQVRGGRGGTGFFVTPRTIITCAHVVATGNTVTLPEVQVVDQQQREWIGVLQAEPPAKGLRRLWAYPDLCAIRLNDPPEDHPVVLLGETPDDSDVYLIGVSDVYEPSSLGTNSGRVVGTHQIANATYRKIADGAEMPEGYSGGPVLDVTHGLVCGVTKTTRRVKAAMGGLVIPVGAIKDAFPDDWEWNQLHADASGRWKALRKALYDGIDAGHYGLTNSEWGNLADAVKRLDYENKLMDLWRDVVGSHPAPPERPLDQLNDLVYDLYDRPLQDGLDPLIKLFVVLAGRFGGDYEIKLERHAEDFAARNGQAAALANYRNRHVKRSRPVIVIRMEPSREPGEVSLTAWAYDYWDAAHRQVSNDEEYGPHSVAEVKEAILEVLNREIKGQPTMIELALPDHMLDEAIEKWPLGQFSLGIRHPLVVRFAEWPGQREGDKKRRDEARRTEAQMRSWKGRFESLSMPTTPSSWAAHWVDCASIRTAEQLYGMLNGPGRPPFIAMTAWPDSGSVPMPVDVARLGGTPVIVWRHKACPLRDPSACNGAVGACPASAFREKVIENLSGATFGELPERIQGMRANAAAVGDQELGLGVAILWDEPDHVPWTESSPYRAPAAPSRPANEMEFQR